MTFKTQVENLIGTVADASALGQFLTDATAWLVDLLPLEKALMFSTPTAVPDPAGVSVAGKRFLGADCAGRPAKVVPANMKGVLADAGSLHQASSLTPAAYLENNTVFVLPAGATNHAALLAYPTVAATDETITLFPLPLFSAVVTRAAIRVLTGRISTAITTKLSGATLTLANAPVAPTLDAINATDAVAVGIAATDIAALTATPTWGFNPTTLDITAQLATLVTDLDTDEDVELSAAKLKEIETRIGKFIQEQGLSIQSYIQTLNAASNGFQADVQKKLTQAKLTQDALIATAQVGTDVALRNKAAVLQALIAENGKKLQLYGAQVNEYTATFQKEIQKYSATVQTAAEEVKAMQSQLGVLSAQLAETMQLYFGGKA